MNGAKLVPNSVYWREVWPGMWYPIMVDAHGQAWTLVATKDIAEADVGTVKGPMVKPK